jgi:hypothetical protein
MQEYKAEAGIRNQILQESVGLRFSCSHASFGTGNPMVEPRNRNRSGTDMFMMR